MSKNLLNKVALITGSGRGIGKALALKFAKEGAKIVINDLDQEPADEAVAEIRSLGGEAVAVVGSVTEEGLLSALLQRLLMPLAHQIFWLITLVILGIQ